MATTEPGDRTLDYRNALYERLRKTLPEGAKIEKEYRHTGRTIDLYVRCKTGFPPSDDEVFFELKLNLSKRNELDRLVGQIQGLDPEENDVFVVFFGKADPTLVGRLEEQYAESVTILEIK
jgi:hypothetical protein